MLALGRKAMTTLDCILKSRDITLPTKVQLVRATVFPVVMYRCESWTIKKAECWRIDAFELWHWRRLLRVPWTARRSNQSILQEISPEYYGNPLQYSCLENSIDGGPWWATVMGSQRIRNNWVTSLSFVHSLEGLMLKLKLQYFGHLMQRTDSLEKTLMLGDIEGRRRG